MIDPSVIGTTIGPHEVAVERGQLRAFAEAIGETDPIYTDPATAQAFGHPDQVVPPTFLFSLDLGTGSAWQLIDALGVDLASILHGEQHFTYHRLAFAGEHLVLSSTVTDVATKKGGAFDVIERSTDVRRDGVLLAELRSILVVRNPHGSQR